MTKKRKRYPDLNQKLERPWCFYCERDFDDLKILISHQKAKHFKCDRCGRRLNTAGGLSVHMTQVHKENLTHVENSIAGRSGLELEIFGMEGVPEEIVEQHNQQVTHKHFEEEQERARVTGNPVRGEYTHGTAPPNKRVKVKETLEELVARANKWRIDKKNGVIPTPAPVEIAQPPPQVLPYGGGPPPNFAQTPQGPPQFAPGQPPFPQNGGPGLVPGFGGQAPFPGGPSPPNVGVPPRPGSIPSQGLPQRPPYGAPPSGLPVYPGQNGGPPPGAIDVSASVDDLISSAVAAASTSTPAVEPAPEKKSKKDKNIRLIYNDDLISPEEKMARLPRYAADARK